MDSQGGSILRQETMAEVVKRNSTSQARKKVHAISESLITSK